MHKPYVAGDVGETVGKAVSFSYSSGRLRDARFWQILLQKSVETGCEA